MRRWLVLLAACGGAAPVAEAPKPPPPPPPAPVDVAWDALEGPVKTVTVVAADATLAPKIQALLAGQIGKPLDRAALRDQVSQVFALQGVGDVTVRGVQQDDGITLQLEITPQPMVHALTAAQADGTAVPVPGQLAAVTGLPLDPVLLDTVAGQLRDQFITSGYPDAEARWTTRPAGSQVDIALVVTPGTRVIVDHVELAGNAHAKSADLLKVMELAPGPWNQLRVDRAVVQLDAYYYDHGFVNVAVQHPAPAAVPTFVIKEGDQFKVGKLSIKDTPAAEEKKLLALLGVKKGDVFSRAAMTAGLQKLQDATKAADITPVTNLDPKKKTIDITFEVQKSVSPSSK
jgi:outer membrane protein insertion porin family